MSVLMLINYGSQYMKKYMIIAEMLGFNFKQNMMMYLNF